MAQTKSSPRRKWCISIAVAAIIIIVIVIVVPLAVILPRKKHNAQKANVVVPLYIYPTSTNLWDPLYNALEIHPTLNFTVIINPNSGPGATEFPDVDYTAAVEKLSTYGNALMVGYVRTGYATRNISTVIAEVDTYASWSSNSSALTMHGIFFDEAPYNYSEQAVDFMHAVNQVVKNSTGLHGPKLVLHNPGLIPDSRFDDNTTDVTVVFEHDYPTFLTKEAGLDALPKNRSEYCYLINSVPTMGLANLTTLVDTLSAEAQYLFLTEETVDFYQSFGSLWTNFTAAMTT